LADEIADGNHHAALEQRDRARLLAHQHELPEAELESEREHEEDDAQLRQRAHRLWIRDQWDRDVRPDDQAGEQVAEYDRLPQPLEYHRCDRGDAKDYRETLEECV